MFQESDIQAVQEIRPDLNQDQASEVLGFLCDVYDDKPYQGVNSKLFKVAAELIYPEVQNEH